MAQWTPAQAAEWYAQIPWPCGFNYVPSTAVNDTEMWQAETFDPETVERELGWAKEIGYNACRVFLQFLVWQDDPAGLLARLDTFLAIADRHGLSVMPVLFDDCAFAGKQPYLGRQDAPVPGVHNSGWVPSPGYERVNDPAQWGPLREYVQATLTRFADDPRVLIWDLYNEPGNGNPETQSLALVEAAFGWAREAAPAQPLTVGSWNPELTVLNAASYRLSDVISFHNYLDPDGLTAEIEALKAFQRPLLCTEWMRRTQAASLIETHLPVLRRERVGCYQWGLVAGKTQTYFPWGSPEGASEPEVWFHDLLHADGRPYRPEEIAVIRREITEARAS